MSQIGEAEGGYGRFFGGISRVEVLKNIFAPVTFGTDLRNIGNHTAALINAAAEVASMEFYIPQNFTTRRGFWISIIGAAASGGMNFLVDCDVGNYNEQYNAHTYSGVLNVGTVVGQINYIPMPANALWAPALALENTDHVGIKVTHQIADGGDATNCYIVGSYISWY